MPSKGKSRELHNIAYKIHPIFFRERNPRGCNDVVDVELTDFGKRWLQECYPPGIVWEYDVDKPFRLHGWAAEFIDLTCLGIPYRIPSEVDGQPTIREAVP